MCAGMRSRFSYDRARDLIVGEEEQSGEMEFDCCVGTSYQTSQMRKDAAAPVCTTGIHVARYRWANKEAAVVTHPDASDLGKGRAAAPAEAKPMAPDASRAFGTDVRSRAGTARAPSSTGSWSTSFRAAWQQSLVIVEKTAVKATGACCVGDACVVAWCTCLLQPTGCLCICVGAKGWHTSH